MLDAIFFGVCLVAAFVIVWIVRANRTQVTKVEVQRVGEPDWSWPHPRAHEAVVPQAGASLAGKRLRPVYRNERPSSPGMGGELPFLFGGRGRDVAFDLQDVDTGEIVRRGKTEREELEKRFAA